MVELKQINELYQACPNCHIHVDVKMAGLNSYQVVVSIVDANGATLYHTESYGSGDITFLKDETVLKAINGVLALDSA